MKPLQLRCGLRLVIWTVLIPAGLVLTAEFGLHFLRLSALVASDPGYFVDSERLRQAEIPRGVPDPVLGVRPNPQFHEHDSWGFRNDRLPGPGETDVVAIGDSQTYGAGVHRPEAWPWQLESQTHLATYNMAYGGFGPAHYLLLLEKALSLRPRLVIAAIYFGNDLMDAYNLAYSGKFPFDLKSKDPQVLQTLEEADRRNPIGPAAQRMAGSDEDDVPFISHNSSSWLQQRSRLYAGWRDMMHRGRLAREPGCLGKTDGAASESGLGAVASTVLTPRYRLLALNQADPRVQEGLRITQVALSRMARQTRQVGVRFLVLLIPTKEWVYKHPVMAQNGSLDADHRQLTESEGAMAGALKLFLKEEGIPHLSVGGILTSQAAQGQSSYQTTENGHPTAAGHEAIAICTGQFIQAVFPGLLTG